MPEYFLYLYRADYFYRVCPGLYETGAKEEGLRNVWVSNGYMTKDALDVITPYLGCDKY